MTPEVQCPRCGNNVSELENIDSALSERIVQDGGQAPPPQVCTNCYNQIAGSIGRGGLLYAREKALEQKRLMLWKSRVNLIKSARQDMEKKAYSQAAFQYEKYIKVLEFVFDAKPGQLKPEDFKDSARTQELTVVASVYWDLVRIYDTNENYNDRMETAAKKLAQFLRFTPIYPDIIRKADSFVKTARNPGAIKSFLRSAKAEKGHCFIASSAFGPGAEEVLILQTWRDNYLQMRAWGQLFVKTYYLLSPPLAYALDRLPGLKPIVRQALRLFIDRAVRHE